ncbi:protein kinase domain-containing protein [Ditylenchus destructor]|uniref:Protein kinase domain-containing protein n=1 Tax=Ditylenchus destructor TaxID=166010 RepID=A0AAD4MIM9_9BILA|nr:protein kinase domain-containing protein [Ditylenchus destructor]
MAAQKVISIFISFAIFINTANCACFAPPSCVPFFGKQHPTKSRLRDYQAKDENKIADVHINKWKKGDFEMQEKLGEGQYGEVWKAVSIKDKNVYAVKKIRKGKNTTVALIRNEIELQRKLDSKFVVRLYNAFKNSSAYYLHRTIKLWMFGR